MALYARHKGGYRVADMFAGAYVRGTAHSRGVHIITRNWPST